MNIALSRGQKRTLARIIIAFTLTLALMIGARLWGVDYGQNLTIFNYQTENLWLLAATFLVYLFIGYDIILDAVKNLTHGAVFAENFLMTVATIGAFLIGQYSEGIAVMLFYQVGEFLQDYAVNKSRKSIADLMDIAPEFANIMQGNQMIQVDPYELKVGDHIIVLAGERIPVDGVVLEGHSSLDTSALTGESLPLDVEKGDSAFSGSINLTGKLIIQVEKAYEDSLVANILDLVENASDQKADVEVFATTFAKYYTPVVLIATLALILIPSLVFKQDFATWLERALIFLVVSCPCALVVSIPLTFFGGIGAASKIGVLVKGSNYLEHLANIKTMVFDKTGTLTHGNFQVTSIVSHHISENELLKIAAHAEYYSNHPIARSIVEAYPEDITPSLLENPLEISGQGIKVQYQGRTILAGNKKLMAEHNISFPEVDQVGSIVYFADDNDFIGYIVINDMLKDDVADTIKALKNIGIEDTIMLTGDRRAVAEKVSQEVGLDHFYAELLPQDKVTQLQKLLSKRKKGLVAYVGDGINDAPVLALADVGIAMGGLGSDAAIEAADVVIMKDQLPSIVDAIKVSRKTLAIAKQNILLALSVKILIMILATLGIANLWLAVFGDVGVTILAVFNAMRALTIKSL